MSAIRAGERYVRYSPAVRRMLLRVGLFVLPGAALWALLPLVASRLLGTGPTGYGVLLAALGAGAVLGADLLPRLAPGSAQPAAAGRRGGLHRVAAGLRAGTQPGRPRDQLLTRVGCGDQHSRRLAGLR